MNTIFSTKAVRLAYGRTLMDNGSSLMTTNGYDFNEPDDGYMVGGLASETKIPLDMCDPNLFHSMWFRYLEEVQKLVKQNPKASYCIGTWVDSGCIVFDVSERIDQANHANDLCKERDEDAYYDSKNMKTIFTSESVPVTRNVEHEEA